jgi:Leucine-rich repeat (LRR) protein
MQVDNSTQPHTTFVSQEGVYSTTFFPSLLPLYGYYDRFKITMPSWPLPAFATTLEQFPAELINKIQAFCSHDDLLALTAVDKAAFATRFCNPRLQKFYFENVEDTEQFLAYCQAIQKKKAQVLTLKEGQKSRKRLEPPLLFNTTTRFPIFGREHLQAVKAVTLTLSARFTVEQYDLLFTYLSGVQHLTLHATPLSSCALGRSLKATQHLNLHHLVIIYPEDSGLKQLWEVTKLPNELWQFTTLKTLIIKGFAKAASISADIGQLKALKSLTLKNMDSLKKLPAILGQLDKLEALTLNNLQNITALPGEISQLTALKSLTLQRMNSLKMLPATLGQLNKLEALTLKNLYCITVLPEDIGQLTALKSFTLSKMANLKALPAKLVQLDKLEALTLKDLYSLTTLPEEIGQFNALKALTLQEMLSLEALPASLWQLNNLEALKLIDLRISILPEEIGQLNALKSLELSILYIRGLPTSLGQLDKLEALTLRGLHLISALPEEIGQLNALKIFKLINMGELETLPGRLAQIVVKTSSHKVMK